MDIQLIQGVFSSEDAISLIGQMIQVKIKYHENKIEKESREEDIKAREQKIKKLQAEFYQLLNYRKIKNLRLEATIKIDENLT